MAKIDFLPKMNCVNVFKVRGWLVYVQVKFSTLQLDEETKERWSDESYNNRMSNHYTETREEIYMLCKIAYKKIQDLNFMVDEMVWPQSRKMEVLLRSYTGHPEILD